MRKRPPNWPAPGDEALPAHLAAPSVIRFRAIFKRFEQPVLSGIDLHVRKGSLHGLVGPGASGKTLILKLTCGLIAPDSGRIQVDGTDLDRLKDSELLNLQQKFGMLFQNNALFDFLSVSDNVSFPLRRRFSLTESVVRQRVAERLRQVGLAGFEERFPKGLSGGQKKRVGIARATITSAPILLYDEPAAGLDPVTSQRIFNLLLTEQRATEATVLMVSSDIERLLSVADRVSMLYEGRIVFDGTTGEAKSTRDPLVRQFLDGRLDGPLR